MRRRNSNDCEAPNSLTPTSIYPSTGAGRPAGRHLSLAKWTGEELRLIEKESVPDRDRRHDDEATHPCGAKLNIHRGGDKARVNMIATQFPLLNMHLLGRFPNHLARTMGLSSR